MNRKIFLILFLTCCICFGSAAVAEDDILAPPTKQLRNNITNDNTSISDFIPKDNKEETQEAKSEQGKSTEKKSWLGESIDRVTQRISSNKPQEVIPVKRSNAAVFDIAGVMLHMNRQQVGDAMQKRGYRQVSADLKIPNFIRWRYEEICRNQNVIGYERLNNCVVKLSKQNNYQFVERLIFNNFETKETVSVRFTSNFTGNKAYMIDYRSEAANVRGSGTKAKYLRNLKIYDFWKQISQKYGTPDNKEQVTWGLGLNKPILRAETGHLVLHDPMLLELDHSRMAREDQKFMNTSVYTF